MIFKNRTGQGVHLFAWNTTTLRGQTGDAANLTGMISIDNGVAAEMDATANGTIIEVGGGGYFCPLLQAETNGNVLFAYGSSLTADVVVDPILLSTEGGAIPLAAFGTLGGLGTVDANNRIRGIAGTLNTFDDIAGPNFDDQYQLDKAATLAEQYAEIKKLFDTQAWPELTAVPGATPTTVQVLMWLIMQAKNNLDDNRVAGQQTVYNDAGTAIGVASRTDDGTTFTRGKFQDAS